MSYSLESQSSSKISFLARNYNIIVPCFLDVKISRENGIFKATVPVNRLLVVVSLILIVFYELHINLV